MEEKRIRPSKTGTYKVRGPRGNGSTQKNVHLHLDPDLVEWFDQQTNRNRYINDLIRDDKARHGQ